MGESRGNESIRRLTDRLAELLATDDGARVLALMQRIQMACRDAGVVASSGVQPWDEVVRTGRAAEIVGIWERSATGEKGVFERSPKMAAEWVGFWANIERIAPKGGRRRIALIGESVARGYLYDPLYTPAAVLQSMLASVPAAGDFEVVDLARVGLTFELLTALVPNALALEPDAIVVFAGNNWRPSGSSTDAATVGGFSPALAEQIGTILRRGGGLAAVRRLMDAELGRRAETIMELLGAVWNIGRVPVFVLVPEFNLVDWRSTDEQRGAPWLGGNRSASWSATRTNAERALADGALDVAAELASQLMSLDGGTSAAGPAILAEVALRRGVGADARRHLESARDAAIADYVDTSPRVYRVAQETLRREGARHGVTVIDLPRVFEDHLGGGLPDRRLFNDYCHLNVEGIQVAMAAVASKLLVTVAGHEASPDELRAAAPSPPAEGVGLAHVLAAMHNAHWGQGYDTLRFHCERALETWSGAAKLLEHYADFQTRRAPPEQCPSFEEALFSSAAAGFYLMASLRTVSESVPKLLDVELVRAIGDVLEARDGGVRARLEALRNREHGVMGRDVDLLHPTYWAKSFVARELRQRAVTRRAFFCAYEATTIFSLVAERVAPVSLSITYRLPPGGPREAEALVEMNGRVCTALMATQRWASARIQLPAELVREGVNELLIRWPAIAGDGDAELVRAADRIELGRPFEFYPCYGHLHALVASGDPPVAEREPR